MAVLSFAEEACWNGEQRRSRVFPIVFRVQSIGKIQGHRVDFTMVGSYDMWYDPDDSVTLDALNAASKIQGVLVDWDHLVFWKKPDHTEIAIIDPMTDEQVGSIRVRKRGLGESGESDMTNVVLFTAKRTRIEDTSS